uniref:WD_REPEATS_REGION domain-containing protein n=1 Tax=Syphacia muris TaxID=451379 RepID=A0A0N5B110_9BILA
MSQCEYHPSKKSKKRNRCSNKSHRKSNEHLRNEQPSSSGFSSSGSNFTNGYGLRMRPSCQMSSTFLQQQQCGSSNGSWCSRSNYSHSNMNYINNFQSTRRRNFRFPDSRQRMQFAQNVLQNTYINRPLNYNRLRENRRNVSGLYNFNESHLEPQSPVPISLANLAVHGPNEEESDIPGFAYDSSTRKYYKIQCESSGSVIGFRSSDFGKVRKEAERLRALKHAQDSWAVTKSGYSSLCSLTSLLEKREMAFRSVVPCIDLRSCLAESALVHAKSTPNYIQEVVTNNVDSLAGCQFLDVSKDGKTLFGCWAVKESSYLGGGRLPSRFIALDVSCDFDIIKKSGLANDHGKVANGSDGKNTYGLQFKAPNVVHEVDPIFVDMVIAPYDSDVTCVLYVTASSHFTRGKLATLCHVIVEPIPELCTTEGLEFSNSPVYNMRWTSKNEIWSCAWNSEKMRLGLGMEESTMIVDVLSDKNFRISSRKKNVLSQQFSQNGEILFMGLRGEDMVCSDLRLKSRHIVNTFEGSNSVGWIKLLHNHPYSLLTDNFAGELNLWDLRMGRKLMSFKGHKNSHYRLPCFVDDDEHFVFAVGEDGIARGWSMRTGDLLCALPSPRPVEEKSEYTRIVYSDRWGGREGNSAVLLAVKGDIRVHELKF